MLFIALLFVFSIVAWVGHDVLTGRENDIGPIDVTNSMPLDSHGNISTP